MIDRKGSSPLVMTSLYRGLSHLVRFDMDPYRIKRVIAGTTIRTRGELIGRIVGGNVTHNPDMKKLKDRGYNRAAAIALMFWDAGIIEQPNLGEDGRLGYVYSGLPETFYNLEEFPRLDERYQIIQEIPSLDPQP